MENIKFATKSTCSFLRRHRRTIGIGVALGVGVAAFFSVREALQEAEAIQKQQEEDLQNQKRREKYLNRAKSEAVTAVLSFLPTLDRRLKDAVDINTPVRKLKALRKRAAQKSSEDKKEEEAASVNPDEEEKNQLWDEVKITAFTRWLVAFYCFGFLSLVEELKEAKRKKSALSSEDTHPQPMELTYEVRHQLMSATFDYLLGPGLLQLTADARQAVEIILPEWTVRNKTEVHYEGLASKLQELRKEIEVSHQQVLGYIIRPDTPNRSKGLAQKLLNETWDAIESPHFYVSLQEGLSITLENLCTFLKTGIFMGPPKTRKEEQEKNLDNCSNDNGSEIQLPTAAIGALIPQIKSNTNKLLADDNGNLFLTEMMHASSA
eukprot:CAMPEP_0117762434 /NCGR_PEP_ID=MMETSP0947-20121206/17933_1 /TAXON_ID=44440 /ORGANISM="Chattonella subsalsa, Strain CCMP2191" /LENGTH=377 /DNA_ID=CAMNT_0005583735 /DNA_START=70 /DNA_END=1200 /DNA_ORIENTATION=-